MEPEERLKIATDAIEKLNPHSQSILDTTAAELAKTAVDYDIKPSDYDRLVGVMIYVKQRVVLKRGRIPSFKDAFPERCVVTDTESGAFDSGAKIGDPLSKSSIDIKAKRLEASPIYSKVYTMLQQNLYVTYAVDRLKVLDVALDKVLDPHVSDRDKAPYMKIFLDETRKPEGAKALEFNLNLTQNNVSVTTVEDKMSAIAKSMDRMNATQIINMVHSDDSAED